MKRNLLAILAGVATFLIGVAFEAKYYFETTGPENPPAAWQPVEVFYCRSNSSSFPGLSKPLSQVKKFRNGFFPVGMFDDGWQNSDKGLNDWYGRYLRTMNETSLLDVEDESAEVYRFLWLRTFDHPVAVRFERRGYSFTLKAVELSGKGGYEPGRLWRTENIPVTQKEWCEFTSILDDAAFWNQEAVDPNNIGNDGSQWILEGLNDRRYHLVDRWTPREGEFREACLYLLKLSGRDEKTLGADLY